MRTSITVLLSVCGILLLLDELVRRIRTDSINWNLFPDSINWNSIDIDENGNVVATGELVGS